MDLALVVLLLSSVDRPLLSATSREFLLEALHREEAAVRESHGKRVCTGVMHAHTTHSGALPSAPCRNIGHPRAALPQCVVGWRGGGALQERALISAPHPAAGQTLVSLGLSWKE